MTSAEDVVESAGDIAVARRFDNRGDCISSQKILHQTKITQRGDDNLKKGAIFDMDGLLFNTESAYKKAWAETAKFYGKDRGVELAQRNSGLGMELCKETVAEFYPDVNVDEFFDHVIEVAKVIVDRDFEVMKGVNEILAFFKSSGVKTAVASSSEFGIVEHNLNKANIREYFDAIVSGEQVIHGKPSPDIFLKAAELIDISPSDCYVFEDSYNGIRGASKAGCTPVMIPDTNQPTDEMRQLCAGIYPSLNDALTAIRRGEI